MFYREYLLSLHMNDVREIARRIDPDFKARTKVALVGMIDAQVGVDWDAAEVENIEFDEAAMAPKGVVINGVTFGSGWNCCKENPAKVMTFDDGGKWAVCISCSHTVSPKRISDLPAEDIRTYKGETETTYTLRDDNGMELATFTGEPALILERHGRAVKRFNPTMSRDRDGKVILTPKQRKRIHKKDRSFARKIGLLSPKGA